jgi:hypothetical protein
MGDIMFMLSFLLFENTNCVEFWVYVIWCMSCWEELDCRELIAKRKFQLNNVKCIPYLLMKNAALPSCGSSSFGFLQSDFSLCKVWKGGNVVVGSAVSLEVTGPFDCSRQIFRGVSRTWVLLGRSFLLLSKQASPFPSLLPTFWYPKHPTAKHTNQRESITTKKLWVVALGTF